jgi:8-oxo-dGTP pyrophosphatase MutT (NUDIX family)
MPFSRETIRHALAQHTPQLAERGAGIAEASVALVLAGAGEALSLCAIRRAEHPHDPWSGHMALPGGRADPADPHPRAVAERETWEEVGLALGESAWLGRMSDVLVRIGGGDRTMIVAPFVYALAESLGGSPPLTPSDEVAEAYWIPLSHLWDPRNASHLEWERGGNRLLYPAIRFGEHAIWGVTFRVLTLFSDILDAPLPHLEEIPGLGL